MTGRLPKLLTGSLLWLSIDLGGPDYPEGGRGRETAT